MCEYCGCQDLEPIATLTAEHDRLRELARDLATAADAGDLARARGLAAAMRAVLGPHTAVEEQGLFPHLSNDFPAKMAALVEEHRMIDAAFADLVVSKPAAGEWPRRIHAALADVFEHILKEQDGVFPAAVATLSASAWEQVAAVRAQQEAVRRRARAAVTR